MKKIYISSNLENMTTALQESIDYAIKNKLHLVIKNGIYNITPIFIKGKLRMSFEDGVILRGITDESLYPLIETRVAGIEMKWYPALLNIIDTNNVIIDGKGIIDGCGEYWWQKYWGNDQKGGMRKDYDARGLRFLCDYDCMRPRNILIQNSSKIKIFDVTSRNSGFWNIHILYSNNILINNVKIDSSVINSPSTDGIDIDSSAYVKIINVKTSCNDDSICIKSGRDSDGIRVNRPSHHIYIESCEILKGFGITIGSEVSGGIYNVYIKNIIYKGTDCGFRIKSSQPRKGYIKNIYLNNLTMIDVKYSFHIYLNWNPLYSICSMPADFKGEMLPHYKVLTTKTSGENTNIDNIYIKNVKAIVANEYKGIARAFMIVGFEDRHIKNMYFKNVNVTAFEYGRIEFVDNLNFTNFKINALGAFEKANDDYDNR